jgi:CRP-like cAMP-binding protein
MSSAGGFPVALIHSQPLRIKSGRGSARLTSPMMKRLQGYGSIEPVGPGAHLFQQGERLVDFFVVVQGQLELYERKGRNSCEVASNLAQLSRSQENRGAPHPSRFRSPVDAHRTGYR